MTDTALDQMAILAGALPFLKRYDDQTVVVKYGGHAMGEEETALRFGRDIALLEQVGVNPVVVHGGGPQINAMLKRLDVKSSFVQGLRVTDQQMLDVVEMVLAGPVNKQVAEAITRAGAMAVGISGKDGGLVRARKVTRQVKDEATGELKEIDLGFVGEPESINPKILKLLIGADIVPVVAPVGASPDGQTYNIHADEAAAAIAGALRAAKLIFLSDVPGIMRDREDPGSLVATVRADQVDALIRQKVLEGGMIPKVQGAVAALRNGVGKTHMIDGRLPHALLLEIFTNEGVGTEIIA